jgi:hypothetical protein
MRWKLTHFNSRKPNTTAFFRWRNPRFAHFCFRRRCRSFSRPVSVHSPFCGRAAITLNLMLILPLGFFLIARIVEQNGQRPLGRPEPPYPHEILVGEWEFNAD